MATDKKSNHPLLAEINDILEKKGQPFDSAVKDFHSHCFSKDECEDESKSEDRKWIEKFKKYRLRIGSTKSPKAKPYRELEKLRDYLKDEVKISPQPLLRLVDDDPICDLMEKLSPKIRERIEFERDHSEPWHLSPSVPNMAAIL